MQSFSDSMPSVGYLWTLPQLRTIDAEFVVAGSILKEFLTRQSAPVQLRPSTMQCCWWATAKRMVRCPAAWLLLFVFYCQAHSESVGTLSQSFVCAILYPQVRGVGAGGLHMTYSLQDVEIYTYAQW